MDEPNEKPRTSLPFDEDRKQVYLERLSKYGNKAFAAQCAGVNYRTAKRHEDKYPNFAEDVEEALLLYYAVLENAALEKAVEGKDKIVVSAGKVVTHKGEPLTEKQYSDGLHALLLKSNMPDKYRERSTIQHQGGGGILVVTNPSEAEWKERLAEAAKKQAEANAEAEKGK